MTRYQRAIAKWLKDTHPKNAKAVAKAAKTSIPYLRHVAHGRRAVGPELAQRLAHAGAGLDPRDLCEVCAKCPLAGDIDR